MNSQAVEHKLARIHWHATIALDAVKYDFKESDILLLRRKLNLILAASTPKATRNLNHIPDPIDIDNLGDYQKDEANEAGPDYDAIGNEASMDDTYVPGPAKTHDH